MLDQATFVAGAGGIMNPNSSNNFDDDRFAHTRRHIAGFSSSSSNLENYYRPVSQLLPLVQYLQKALAMVVNFLNTCNPDLDLPAHFRSALEKLDYEIIAAGKQEDLTYRALFDLLRKEIFAMAKYHGATHAWHAKLQKKISGSFLEKNLLSAPPCKVFYFFFRFIALLLYFLKTELNRENKMRFAQEFLQFIDKNNDFSLQTKEKKCELQTIFQYCLKNSLKNEVLCHCQTALGDNPGASAKMLLEKSENKVVLSGHDTRKFKEMYQKILASTDTKKFTTTSREPTKIRLKAKNIQEQTKKKSFSQTARLDLTRAASVGAYNPQIAKDGAHGFSWESILAGSTIVKGELWPQGVISTSIDAIRIKKRLAGDQQCEIYQVQYSRLPMYKYAIKIPLLPIAKNKRVFETELQNLNKISTINNPHLPKIISGSFKYQGEPIPYYLTAQTESAEQLFKNDKIKPLHPFSALLFFYSLLRSLASLSYNHIVHKDITRRHVRFYQDIVVLTNFQNCKLMRESQRDTQESDSTLFHGTPHYLPPELINVEKHGGGQSSVLLNLNQISAKTDIWAAGLVFMEWLTGQHLFPMFNSDDNALHILENVHNCLQKKHLENYKTECYGILHRLYFPQKGSAQHNLNTERLELNKRLQATFATDVHRINVEDIEIDGNFLNNLLKIFELCTLPFAKRPEAEQLMSTIGSWFPWVKEKYAILTSRNILPPTNANVIQALALEYLDSGKISKLEAPLQCNKTTSDIHWVD